MGSLKVWMLTPIGHRIARNTHNPNTPVYVVLHALDKLHSATQDQLANYTGLPSGAVGMALSSMSHNNPPYAGVVG